MVVAAAARGIDAVVHLAGIANPAHQPAAALFANNTQATFTVLWGAAEQGVRRFAIASSVQAIGLTMNPYGHAPARYPIDVTTPPDLADPYGLGKHTDEQTLRAVGRRFGAAGVALRLPLMINPANLAAARATKAAKPGEGAGEGWGWLDVRDGAEAFRLGITADFAGVHVLYVCASTVFDDRPTEELLRTYVPEVPRDQSFPGRQPPVDTEPARRLLGFTPRYNDPW
jgi:nucleoside-diphosphate-sugar epimerase